MNQIGPFIQHHWQLVLAFAVVLGIIFAYEYLLSKKQAKNLSPSQVVEQINHHNAQVIDIRSVELFNKGHIIGAIRANTNDFQTPKLQKYKDKPIVLVCTRGLESQPLVLKLRALGFTQLMVLAGGLDAWKAAQLPLVTK